MNENRSLPNRLSLITKITTHYYIQISKGNFCQKLRLPRAFPTKPLLFYSKPKRYSNLNEEHLTILENYCFTGHP